MRSIEIPMDLVVPSQLGSVNPVEALLLIEMSDRLVVCVTRLRFRGQGAAAAAER